MISFSNVLCIATAVGGRQNRLQPRLSRGEGEAHPHLQAAADRACETRGAARQGGHTRVASGVGPHFAGLQPGAAPPPLRHRSAAPPLRPLIHMNEPLTHPPTLLPRYRPFCSTRDTSAGRCSGSSRAWHQRLRAAAQPRPGCAAGERCRLQRGAPFTTSCCCRIRRSWSQLSRGARPGSSLWPPCAWSCQRRCGRRRRHLASTCVPLALACSKRFVCVGVCACPALPAFPVLP